MKYAFIVNPASGQGRHKNNLIPQIEELIERRPDKNIKIYYTCSEKDATPLASRIAKEANDEVVIFACGGDGTIQEVANGIYGNENAILATVPVGSGNDFVRALGGGMKKGKKFLNLESHLDANAKVIDLIKLTWQENGEKKEHIVVNGINIGFDGYTAITAHDYKKLPGVSGTGSYILAVGKNLIEKRGEDLKIVADDKELHNGQLLLTTVGNGGFCGGGFESCPRADLSDGLLELLIVNDVSRAKFLKLIPKYKSGKILGVSDEGGALYKYAQVKKVVFTPLKNETMQFVADGEICETGELVVEVLPKAMNVICF